MEEEDNIIVKWAQEDVETSYNLLNNNNNNNVKHGVQIDYKYTCCILCTGYCL